MVNAGARDPQVLVVDDDPDIVEALIEVLEDHGFSAQAASNGADALDKLRASAELPRVILLDLMMPVMDGYGFRAAQQADERIAAIPVIVLSAHANVEQAAEQMNAAGCLRKPVQLQTLLATVASYCES